MGSIVILFSLLTSCVSYKIPNYTYNKKLPVALLKEDLTILKKTLEANHPSLYWYNTKDSIDFNFENALSTMKDSLNEVQFKKKVAEIISTIHCGHTSVNYSKNFTKLYKHHLYPMFPLYLKVWADSMVVLGNTIETDSILKRGVIITSINGVSNRLILDSIFKSISTDGYSVNYKNQVVSNNFPAWYKQTWGLDTSYTISYLDSLGNKATTTIKNYSPIKDTSTIKKEITKIKKPNRKQLKNARRLTKRYLQIDTSLQTAYIRINTFSEGRLRKFFRKTMKTISKDEIKNVVIDLRQNGGGDVGTTTKLLKYFANSPFKHADTVEAINRTFPHKKYLKNWWLYWIPMNFFATKERDKKIHYRRFEHHYFKPKSRYHFNGQVYLIQGGMTFSAATMFIATLKGQENAIVVGEETGGGFYGNSAVHLPTIILPNSKLRISLPMYRMVMNKNRPKGRGIIPDIYIPPSSIAIKEGYDTKIVTIRKLIEEKNMQPK